MSLAVWIYTLYPFLSPKESLGVAIRRQVKSLPEEALTSGLLFVCIGVLRDAKVPEY